MSNPTEVTIALLLRGTPAAEILLGWKKRGIGESLFTGIGGRVELGETALDAAIREVREEIGVEVLHHDLHHLGTLNFRFPAKPEWNEVAQVFLITRWKGEPMETEEIRPAWFPVEQIPYEKMWHDYSFWLPDAIQGQPISATFTYAADNKTVDKYGKAQ